MTGGAAHNDFVEGEAMKKLAVSEGVPADDVIVEGDTIQNIATRFSKHITGTR